MISKELLNKVLNIEIVSYQMKQKNILAYEYNKVSKNQWSGKTFCNRSMNIYELAHKCKEWAFNKDKYKWLFSYKAFTKCHCDIVDNHNRKYIFVSFAGNNEPEAIFKACQWILDKDSK